MRSVRTLAALLSFAAGSWAQITGPQILNVVGAADYSSAGTVGVPQGSIFNAPGRRNHINTYRKPPVCTLRSLLTARLVSY